MDEAATAAELELWRRRVGQTETRRQRLDVEALRRFALAVDADPDVERTPPPLGHWAWFLETAATDRLGPDGHPQREGSSGPSLRRMFASANVSFDGPLVLGHDAELALTVADVKRRAGQAGDLVFVEVDRVLTQDGAVRLRERQTLVYRAAGGLTPPVTPAADVDPIDGDEAWTPGPVELFRFSAVTFNSHRIHYDLAYATEVEGYPGLVVQGPFTAAKLCALARRRGPQAPMRAFSFRATAPAFAGQTLRLRAAGGSGAGSGEVQALRCDGAVAMTARAVFAPD